MECRKFELTLIAAYYLPNVRSVGRMKVYAEVSINGKSRTTMKTGVDKEGETNPTWRLRFDYTLTESAVQQPGANVVVKLFCKRTLGDRLVGEVKIPVKSLFDMGLKAEETLSYNVGGTENGVLYFVYSFGEKFLVPKDPAWKKVLEFGFGVLIEGVMFFLSNL